MFCMSAGCTPYEIGPYTEKRTRFADPELQAIYEDAECYECGAMNPMAKAIHVVTGNWPVVIREVIEVSGGRSRVVSSKTEPYA